MTRANEAHRIEFMRQVREEHSAIVEAIRRRDAVAARNAAATHMFNAAKRLVPQNFNPRRALSCCVNCVLGFDQHEG